MSRTAPTSSSVRADGYRYKRRTRSTRGVSEADQGDDRGRPLGPSGPGRAVAAVGGQILGHQDHLADGPAIGLRRLRQASDLIDDREAGRERCGPRKLGMAQKPHARSQPSAIFT